jgi:hypothetical protein
MKKWELPDIGQDVSIKGYKGLRNRIFGTVEQHGTMGNDFLVAFEHGGGAWMLTNEIHTGRPPSWYTEKGAD